jgi:hypothetical protein
MSAIRRSDFTVQCVLMGSVEGEQVPPCITPRVKRDVDRGKKRVVSGRLTVTLESRYSK